jgi:hypothetical protein
MDDQPNPYESPKTESRAERPAELPRAQPSDGWKFGLLGIAIVFGFVSFYPWLAAIFSILSAPVFIRYFLMRQRSALDAPPSPDTIFAGISGAVGLALGIAAASMGAFLGVCTLTTYATGIAFAPALGRDYEPGIFVLGIVVGAAVLVVAGVWMVRRLWPWSKSD